MKGSSIRFSGVLACAAACSAVAGAQMSGQSGVSGRIGLFLPSNSQASDAGSTWLSFGLDYRINSTPAPAMVLMNATGSYFSISGDYYSKGGFRNIPIAVNYNVRAQQLTFAIGVGADIETVSDNEKIGLGGNVAVTYDFMNIGRMGKAMSGAPIFLQAKYFVSSHSELNGLGVYLGMRF